MTIAGGLWYNRLRADGKVLKWGEALARSTTFRRADLRSWNRQRSEPGAQNALTEVRNEICFVFDNNWKEMMECVNLCYW